MSVAYVRTDGIGRKIIPAPLVTINKQYNTNPDGRKVGSVYNITLEGTLLPWRGSPSGNYSSLDDAFHTLGGYPADETYAGGNEDFDNILRKQEALRWLFSQNGGSLEWQPSGGQPVVKCNARVIAVDFEPGQWVNRCDYRIQLQANWIYINGTEYVEDTNAQDMIESSTENWSFNEIAGRESEQLTVRHEVSAKGIIGYEPDGTLLDGKQAWEHAKDYVDLRATGSIDSSILTAAGYSAINNHGHFVRTVSVDENGGSYTVTEEWTISDTSSYREEEFNVEFRGDTGDFTVSYRGTIYGVDNGSITGDIDNMQDAKDAIPSESAARTRVNNQVGSLFTGSLPSSVSSKSFVLNKEAGTVAYTFVWDTSDSEDSTTSYDVQLSFSKDNQLYTMSLTQNVEGKGADEDERFDNAKDAILTDSAAKNLAESYLGAPDSQIPQGVNFNDEPINKTTALNVKAGTARVNWSWTNREEGYPNGTEVESSVQIQEAATVIASIPIPGRATGPIIQNMETLTSETVTVTMRGKGYSGEPNWSKSEWNPKTKFDWSSDYIIIGDTKNWSNTNGTAERIVRYIKET